ncbi:ribulose-phosphate 3-epimerase, partial [Persicitalea sp.]|uniref:ribulose-phosphate 3-epimerase n=1 Tax=Persicitalea sp. TaxID=3100273 RepID=UPI003593DFEB
VLGEVSQVLIMSVNPGFGGQSFIENTYRKVRELVELRADAGVNFDIEVDGGVNDENAPMLVDAGADVLVAGSFVFKSDDPMATIRALKGPVIE